MRNIFSVALGAFVVSMVLVSSAATDPEIYSWRSISPYVARADTDSVAVDTLDVDSLLADSLALPDSALVFRYLPSFKRDAWAARLSPYDRLPFSPS